MSVQEVRSTGTGAQASSERTRVLVLGLLIIGGIALYIAFRGSDDVGDSQRNLLPYQTLARTLPEADQAVFRDLRQGLLQAEADRARVAHWPKPETLESGAVAPFTDASGLTWQMFTQGMTTTYLGLPSDPAGAAWMLTIQEPEPNAPPDPAPNDDEHHRLPDGTTLHIYVWRHQYGGRVKTGFIPQPQVDGWTQVFSVPPNPVFPLPRLTP